MHLTAWLIGHDAEAIFENLIAHNGYPKAQVWVPLESTKEYATQMARYQSAWATRTTNGEQWIDFALPADVIKDAVGPDALAHPRTLTHGTALAKDVESRDGELMVMVPRYFSTVATQWSQQPVGQRPLVTKTGRETMWATLGQLDLKASFRRETNPPDLVVDEHGPRRRKANEDRYYNVSGLKEAGTVMTAIRKLPPDTPIRSVWCAE